MMRHDFYRIIMLVVIAATLVIALIMVSLSANRDSPQPDAQRAVVAVQAEDATSQPQKAADTPSKAGADAQLEQDDREVTEQANRQNADANAPTVLTTDYCRSDDFKGNLLGMVNNALQSRSPISGRVTDLSLYHINGEIADHKLVCTASANFIIDTALGTRTETYSGVDVELRPGSGGRLAMRILSLGTQTMGADVNGTK